MDRAAGHGGANSRCRLAEGVAYFGITMVSEVNRQELHRAIDELPPSEFAAALRYLRFLCQETLEEEPIDSRSGTELDAARERLRR